MDFELSVKVVTLVIVVLFFALRSNFTTHYKKFTSRTLIKWVILIALMELYFGNILNFAILDISQEVRIFVGLSVILLGFALFFWAHIHLGKNWSPIIEKKFAKSRSLVRSGPYRYIRHPIYTASFIVLVGFFVFTANWLLVGIPLVILIIFYSRKIPKEEDELIRNFGKSYKDYMKTTGGLVPKF